MASMEESPLGTPVVESLHNPLDELSVHRGVPLPNQMVPPGQDGCRTPTVEDYQQHVGEAQIRPRRPGLSNRGSHVRIPTAALFRNLNSANLGQSILERLEWRERIRHYTWTFFTMTMATGGIANVLYSVPFRFRGLEAIGVVFFIFNGLLFVLNVIMISLRFRYHPETFMASFLHPTERLFVPSAVVSMGTILINISQYGIPKAGPWLDSTVLVTFWIDATLACLASSGIYLAMWSTKAFMISQMTPTWIFPAYPMLIVGPHAAILSSTLSQRHAFAIIVAGFAIQGTGFLVSMMIYSEFINRLMTQKLPQERLRPGMFVSVGPSGFTVAGVLGMAQNIQRAMPKDFMGDDRLVSTILKVVATWISLWIWGLALWFFIVSVGAHWSCVGKDKMTFSMTWYSYVFPNTALLTATFAIGKAFESPAIQIIGCVMTPILIAVWFFVFGMMIRAIVLKQILWPQKEEDKDEAGFKGAERPFPTKRSNSSPV